VGVPAKARAVTIEYGEEAQGIVDLIHEVRMGVSSVVPANKTRTKKPSIPLVVDYVARGLLADENVPSKLVAPGK
jgi:hypothetical protein